MELYQLSLTYHGCIVDVHCEQEKRAHKQKGDEIFEVALFENLRSIFGYPKEQDSKQERDHYGCY